MKVLKLRYLIGAALSCVVLALSFAGNAYGATIASTAATWPTFDALNETASIDANSVVNANRGISGTRIDRQSFNVTNTFTVDTIYLSAANYNSNAFTISFFQTTAVNANPIVSGTQVGSTITVDPLAAAVSGNMNLEISLLPSEYITFAATTGTAGYVMAIQLADSTTPAAFNWVHSNTGTDIYKGGRYRRDDNDQTSSRDFGFALVQTVPEPTALALFAVGSGLLVVNRRRKAAAQRA